MTPRRSAIGLVLLVVAFAAAEAHAQMFVPAGKDTLRGLPGVEVIVEELEPGLAPTGLTVAAIGDDVRRQLAASNIIVYATQMQNASLAKPYVYVHVSGVPVQGQGYFLTLQVQLRQTLKSPVTGSNVVNAMTWDQQMVVFVPASNARSVIQGELRSLIAQFVQDWRATR